MLNKSKLKNTFINLTYANYRKVLPVHKCTVHCFALFFHRSKISVTFIVSNLIRVSTYSFQWDVAFSSLHVLSKLQCTKRSWPSYNCNTNHNPLMTEPETATWGSGGLPWRCPACATCADPSCVTRSPRTRWSRCPSPRGSSSTSPTETSPTASRPAAPLTKRSGKVKQER